ncbi:MAG: DNA-binding response regulator [Bacteroidetes bacterium QH_2_63_10]|nr:MAG: DNA-binding response regulator [Bacteroidetes bacterium QH_2_63_10]
MAPSNASIRALVVDDEPLARERLRGLLDDRSGVSLVAEAEDGQEAVDALRGQDPDLVFDQYAIKAFDLAAVDYLLKPFDDERFEQALERAREQIVSQDANALSHRLLRMLKEQDPSLLDEVDTESDEAYLERIAVQGRGKARIVSVNDVTHITADGSYAEVHTEDDTHVIRERMKTLAARLDPSEFVRVHRSAIVRLDEVELILRSGGGDYAVRLQSGTTLSVSRGRIEELQDRLGVDVVQRDDRSG